MVSEKSLEMANVCAFLGCSNRSNWDEGKSFYHLPTVIENQGINTKELSERRERVWFAAIQRKNLSGRLFNVGVCSDRFIKGKPSALYESTDPDWVPSVKLGHRETKTVSVTSRLNRSLARASKRRKMEAEAVSEDKSSTMLGELSEVECKNQDDAESLKRRLNKVSSELEAACNKLARLERKLQAYLHVRGRSFP